MFCVLSEFKNSSLPTISFFKKLSDLISQIARALWKLTSVCSLMLAESGGDGEAILALMCSCGTVKVIGALVSSLFEI